MPALLPELHRGASTWYEHHDLIIEAVHHARLAPDVERTIRLIEQHTHSLALLGQAHTVLNWLHALPDGLVRTHPRLCFSQALLLLFTGQLGKALLRLQDAEQSASHITPADEAPVFLNQVATVQAYILFLQGDLASSVALAEQASDQLAERPVQEQEVVNLIAAHRLLVSGDVRRVGEQRVARLASPLEALSDVFAMDVFVRLASILQQARKKNTSALALVDAFVQLTDARQFAPAQLAFASAVRAQIELMGGNLAAAMRWAEASGLSSVHSRR